MSNTSVQYGVQKLIIINSGKYSYAELDLTGPVHLSAPNNRGKSTLVNALQFLYVDELRAMRFGSRSTDDTKRHYFGTDPSYIVFECMTPLGLKCLLVAGQGLLNNCQFLRFVYDGQFNLDDYRNPQNELFPLDQMRIHLAGRNLAELKPGNLWEVLGDPRSSSDNNSSLPRMNILPVRTRDEYRSFRDAFIRLLALSNVSARELRELLITCHARDITCSKIDVAADHREEFERAEQVERTLLFTQAVVSHVERGRKFRDTLKEHAKQLSNEVKLIAQKLAHVYHQITMVENACHQEEEAAKNAQDKLNDQVDQLNKNFGSIERSIDYQQNELNDLESLHRKWSTCTDEMIDAMLDNHDNLQHRITRITDHIQLATKQNLNAFRRNTLSVENDLASCRRILDNWETRSINKLREMKMPDDDIEQIFRILNPQLANLSIGKDIQITDAKELQTRLEKLINPVDGNQYTDSALQLDLSHVANTVDMTGKTREDLEHDIATKEVALTNAKKQLSVAENQAQAKQELLHMKKEYKELDSQLREYDNCVKSWSKKQSMVDKFQLLKNEKQSIVNRIDALKDKIQKHKLHLYELEQVLQSCREERYRLQSAVKEYNDIQAITFVDKALITLESNPHIESIENTPWDTVQHRSEKLGRQLNDMKKSANEIKNINRRLDILQKEITDESRQYQGQTIYFSDPDGDWSRLSELVDSLGEQENVVDHAWTSLFTRLGAKLDGIKQGVTEINRAVKTINRGLSNYHVSNLRSVQLEVVVQKETYDLIETLTDEGSIFQDREKIDRAKEQMRRWISAGKIIQLDELFAIHIQVHDLDRDRPTEAKSLDEIGSTGTGMTAKAMVFIQLVRAVVSQDKYILHFYMDETGQLDERNLFATTRMAVDCGVMPITADPDVRIEPLAHPTVTVYSLGQNQEGKFYIDGRRTCHGKRVPNAVEEPAV